MKSFEEWEITEESFCPEEQRKNEAIFSLGNGYLGMRGGFEEGGNKTDGTYLNGFYETGRIRYGEIAYGFPEESQTMLNLADGKSVELSVCGEPFQTETGTIQHYRRSLSLRDGVLTREIHWTSPGGRKVKLEFTRLVSLTQQHLAAVRCRVTPINFDGELQFVSSINGDVGNLAAADDPRVGSGLEGQPLTVVETLLKESGGGLVQATKNSRLAAACFILHEIPLIPSQTEKAVHFSCTVQASQETPVEFVKYIAYTDGKAGEGEKLLELSQSYAREGLQTGFEGLLQQQREYLDRFWDGAGVTIQGDSALSQGLRFNMFQLLQSAGRDGKTNIAAKGLTGEGYEGHYFWDTETYLLPLFIHCEPEVARQLLRYRYSILDNARQRAREMGHPKGALFPWRTINGNECSAYYPAGTAQYHINADISFALKRYVECTGDNDFLVDYGAEMLAETARLWYDLGFFSQRRNGQFCIQGVTGPDEYNAVVDNNCYTNLMAQVNLAYAAQTIESLRREHPVKYKLLAEKIQLDVQEPAQWQRAAEAMLIPFDEESGLYPQDDGFLDRKPWPLSSIPKENFPLLLHYHPLVIYRHQVCKQADLILAMVLLGGRFTQKEKQANFDFYDEITTHDSSLSMATFSILASELGMKEKAYEYFRGSARMDLDNTHGNTGDGLHMANMAGAWMCVVNGFAGMRAGETLSFRPFLPKGWTGYQFKIRYQGRVVQVEVDASGAVYRLISGEPMSILADGKTIELQRG